MPIFEPWVQTNGQLQSLHNFQQTFGQTAPSAWKCLKIQFWDPLTNWKFEPSPHTLTSSLNNEQVKKLRMDLPWHALNSMLQAKTLYHTGKQGFGYPWLSKKIPHTPTKTRWSWAQFQKGQPTPCKTTYAFPAYLWVSTTLKYYTAGLESPSF